MVPRVTQKEHVHRASPRVYIVDDCEAMCRSLETLLSVHGFEVRSYTSALQFQADADRLPNGLLLVDLRMDEMSGMELIEKLTERHSKFPMVMMTAHGDIDLAVKAMKLGARDFIQKPFRPENLLEIIHRELSTLDAETPAADSKVQLTGREREVAYRLADGLANKQIAFELGISVRTVEMHRARAMTRLGAKTFAELLRALMKD